MVTRSRDCRRHWNARTPIAPDYTRSPGKRVWLAQPRLWNVALWPNVISPGKVGRVAWWQGWSQGRTLAVIVRHCRPLALPTGFGTAVRAWQGVIVEFATPRGRHGRCRRRTQSRVT